MVLTRSPAERFRTSMPTFMEWERSTGGPGQRHNPLLKYIDRKVYEHGLRLHSFQRTGAGEAELASCLVQLWNATRLYMKAFTKGASSFGRDRRNPTRGDGFRRVNLPDGESHLRSDAVGALHTLVARDLMALTGATNEQALKTTIKKSATCEMTAHDRNVDYKDGRLVATYLGRDERAKWRVIFERSSALMHPRDPSLNPLDWVEADTCDTRHSVDSFKNPCYMQFSELLHQASTFESFHVGNDDAKAYWARVRPLRECGLDGYVMTHGRKFYMSPVHKNGSFFHSAHTSGTSVACSGSVTFVRGVPTLLTNASGHYQPPPEKLNQVVSLFEMAGLPLDRLSLGVVRPGGRIDFYSSVAEFRRSLRS